MSHIRQIREDQSLVNTIVSVSVSVSVHASFICCICECNVS